MPRGQTRPFRAYEIERDADGMPTRMFWLGDYVRCQPPHYLTCPRCGSKRLVEQRCFDCWWRPMQRDTWRRV